MRALCYKFKRIFKRNLNAKECVPLRLILLPCHSEQRLMSIRLSSSKVNTDTSGAKRVLEIRNLGVAPYTDVWDLQKDLQRQRFRKDHQLNDVLLMVEHPPVYTLGRGATEENIDYTSICAEASVHRVERGGEVTFHGPGQAVFYPILDLNFHKRDLHWYLRSIESVIINTLAKYAIEADRDGDYTGVWVKNRKIAAIGISASKWIVMHGAALNVTTDLSYFQSIVPCGIHDRDVASLHEYVHGPSIEEVQAHLCESFCDVFNMEPQHKNLIPKNSNCH